MSNFETCPCGSQYSYSSCCEPFILSTKYPLSAEQLMRSRYSAYVNGAIDYLVDTTHSSTRKNHKRTDIENWSKTTKWLKLEIVRSTETTVEFIARFEGDKESVETHHEKSIFLFEDGKWCYVDGEFY